ncbi:MAG: secretin N-terminal domain-containing protein [Thermoguttaceae bacterium]
MKNSHDAKQPVRVACLVGIGTWFLLAFGSCGASAAQAPAASDYRAYPLQHKTAAEIERMLRDVLPGLGVTTDVMGDAQTNRILLRGPEQAHDIARQLIDSSDRPETAAATEQPVVQVYTCDASRVQATADRIRSTFSTFGVRVAVDPRSPQLLVLAPPSIHTLVARLLSAAPSSPVPSEPPRPLPKPNVVAAVPQPNPAEMAVRQSLANREIRKEEFVSLANAEVAVVESRLRDLLGARLEPLASRDQGWPDYVLSDKVGEHVELYVERRQNGIRVVGKQALANQMARLIRTLDSPAAPLGKKIRVLPMRRADPTKVREAVEAYRTGGRPYNAPAGVSPPANESSRVHYGNMGVELVAYLFQPAGAEAAGPEAKDDMEGATLPLDGLAEPGPDVEYEVLPDLDVIILRGRESDVDDVTRMIEEIERISAETIPEIDIYFLKHVQGSSISEVVSGVSLDLLGGRQGRISVTPLMKPNALLLIGWGEAVKAVRDLIWKLDQPVQPNTQFRIFTLEHAAVATVGATILQTFASQGSLSPQVQLTPDMRLNALVVRAAPTDMAEVEMLIQRLDVPTPGPVSQARVFKLQHSLANDLATTLQQAISSTAGGMGTQRSAALELFDVEGQRLIRSGVLDDVQITPDMRTNTLVVAAPAESMELVAALITHLDSPSAVAQIKVFRIRNGDATSMATMLQGLLPSATVGPRPQLPGAEGESSLVPVRFSVDTRTNSIIATGSEGDLAIIEALLTRLDEEDVQSRINDVYRLKNAPAPDVAESINEFLRSERTIQQATPGAVSAYEQIEKEIVVVPEIVSNSLIISAAPEYYKEIMALIEKLDAQPPQVMIQVLIAEVTLNDTEEFGIELGLQDSVLFDRSLIADLETIKTTTSDPGQPQVTTEEIVAATNTPGFLFNNQPNNNSLGNTASRSALRTASILGSQGIANFGVNRINSELGFGGLILSASSETVSAMIRALKENRRLDVLSRPQVMTLDNQPAFIQVGKRVPRITGSTAQTRGLVNTIELENVGLILGVTPRISPDGMVVMEIDAEKSDLDRISEGIPVAVSEGTEIRSPSINVTMAQTTVSAASGQTIVLGGLITQSESVIHRSVPWLGDIPVIGNFFRFDGQTCKRAELLIVLTPHVIKNQEEAERLKRVEAARMHWCLADVNQLHGETGLVDISEGHDLSDGSAETIFPDADPLGSGVEPPRDGNWESLDVIQPPGLEEKLDKAPRAAPRPTPAPPVAPPVPPAMQGQTPAGPHPPEQSSAVPAIPSPSAGTQYAPVPYNQYAPSPYPAYSTPASYNVPYGPAATAAVPTPYPSR